ncbi:uncharacterized protein LOC120250502 [Dioscorea cayenensis subsp. rotundata]|uniref:Uncharacterized protein LOC120250502 n=1 Tax=Dioscorea cayennensis subsp. rotundata TaxID=55577 RepID=A0AB40ALZ2_DIOCR|nr:uncharacterized protein LOC120250502 [Dioscorea cayenensis subsp. rotundata]
MVTADFTPTLQCGVPRSGLMGAGVVNPARIPAQSPRTRRGASVPFGEPTPAQPPSVHAPGVPGLVPQTVTQGVAPPPEALQSFKPVFVSPPPPPPMPSVQQAPVEDSKINQSLILSKVLKEARQLGCNGFDGSGDAMAAKEWLKRLVATFEDMGIEDELKLKVGGRSDIPLTWSDFLHEFDKQYYTRFYLDQKRQEYMKLVQGNKAVAEYEAELKELANFVPEVVGGEEALCSKFEAGLNLSIREKIAITGNQSFKEVVQFALRAEKLVLEGKRLRENLAKRRNPNFSRASKRSKSEDTSSGFSGYSSVKPPSGQAGSQKGATSASGSYGGKSTGNVPRCQNCNRFYPGQYREPRRCYQCGQTGHLKSACLELDRGTPGLTPPSAGRQSQSKGLPPTASTHVAPTISVAVSNSPQDGTARPQTRSQTRVFDMTNEEAEDRPNVITGTVSIFQHDAYVLIDSRSERSFVSTVISCHADRIASPLYCELLIQTPLREVIIREVLFQGCPIKVKGVDFEVDLIPLEMRDFDAILGMDWLNRHKASIDCFRKEVTLQTSLGLSIVFKGERKVLSRCVISSVEARKLVRKGCEVYLAHIIDTIIAGPNLRDVAIVQEFEDVFFEELPGLPPDREFEFVIDLLPGTAPNSIPPYRMAPQYLRS